MIEFTTAGGDGCIVTSLQGYLGPYEAWNFGIGRPYAFPAFRRDDMRYLSALAEYPAPETVACVASRRATVGCRMWLPTLWGRNEEIPLRFWPMVVENCQQRNVTPGSHSRKLGEPPQGDGVEEPRFRMAFPVSSATMHDETETCPADPDWSVDPRVKEAIQGKTINVLAVIDDGIPFAHQNFRAADGKRTRLEFCWLQSAPKELDRDPQSVLFGREYSRHAIEQLIQDHGEDEDALYAAAGASSDLMAAGAAINRLVTHGAHVMDVAAGCDPRRTAAPPEETRLIAVQLPNASAWDTSSFGKDMYMLAALHYVLERAERIAAGYDVENIRVVINFSYGFSAGRHDGATELEAAIHELVSQRRSLGRPTAIVLPSGNTFSDRLHGVVSPGDFKDDVFEFTWKIQPNDRTSNYLEIWFPANFDPADFSITIQAPFGKTQATLVLKPNKKYKNGDPRSFEVIGLGTPGRASAIGQMSVDNHRGSNRWRVLLILGPSEPDDSELPAAPAGDWLVSIKRGPDAPVEHPPIYLWIQRDVDLEAFRSGSRQSYLHDPAYRKFDDRGGEARGDDADCHVRRFGTINGLATGTTTLIVSGCMPSAEASWEITMPVPSSYSSAGKASSGDTVGTVDCTAPADRSSLLPGRIAAGTRSGSYAALQGTSVAAPLVARRIAEAFATCRDDMVRAAERDNYLSLLDTVALQIGSDEDRARLGSCLVL